MYTACIGMYVAIQCFVYWILHESELVELKLEQPDCLHIAMYIHMFASAYVCNYTRLEPIMLLKLPISYAFEISYYAFEKCSKI